jgi:hypothetical protein
MVSWVTFFLAFPEQSRDAQIGRDVIRGGIPQVAGQDKDIEPSPTPVSQFAASVTGMVDTTRIEVGSTVRVYVAFRNTAAWPMSGIKVDLVVPQGLTNHGPLTQWPSVVQPGQSVTRMYSVEAEQNGEYNVGVVIYFDNQASEGQLLALDSVSVGPDPGASLASPAGATSGWISAVAVIVGTLLGFGLTYVRDAFRERTSREEMLLTSYSQILAWLRETRVALQRIDVPTSAITGWNNMPVTNAAAYRILKKYDTMFFNRLQRFFGSVISAQLTDHADLLSENDSLIAALEAKL